MTDTFVAWSFKVATVCTRLSIVSSTKALEDLQRHSLTFQGASITKGMVVTAQSALAAVDSTCHADFVLLDRCFGRDVLSNSFEKIRRLLNALKNHATSDDSVSDLLSSCIRMVILTLRQGEVDKTWFTIASMNGSQSNTGWTGSAYVKLIVVTYMRSLISYCIGSKEQKDFVDAKLKDPWCSSQSLSRGALVVLETLACPRWKKALRPLAATTRRNQLTNHARLSLHLAATMERRPTAASSPN
jgi:hypothetical protein